jgi:hypothetical protein
VADSSVVPYLLLGESRRRRLQERLGALVDSWYRTWAPPTAAEPLAELAPAAGREPTVRGDTWVFAAAHGGQPVLKATVPTDLLRILNGIGTLDSAHGSLILRLTETTVTALCAEICGSAFPGARCPVTRLDPATSATTTGAQVLLVSVTLDRPRPLLELVLTPVLIDALLAGRPAVRSNEALTPRRRACQEQPARVTAILGTATVSWRDLQALSEGDVIVLDQSLTAPCTLRVGTDRPIADAQLGRVGNSLAAQIMFLRNEK